MADEALAIVIDTGTDTLRAGIAGEEIPTCICPSAVGINLQTSDNSQPQKQVIKCGDDLNNLIAGTGGNDVTDVQIRRIIKRCIIHGWDELECLWEVVLKKNLKLSPEEHPLLLTEPPLNPKLNRELATQVAMEKLGVPAMYIAITSVLVLYGTGRIGGLVVESGEGATFTVPVVEGYIMHHACQRLNIGGMDLTAYICDIIDAKRNSSTNINPHRKWRDRVINDCNLSSDLKEEMYLHAVQKMKKQLCYVAADLEREELLQKSDSYTTDIRRNYELPDGVNIGLAEERWKVPECMFNPVLLGRSYNDTPQGGIHNCAFQSINKCDPELRRELCSNIIVAGGNSGFDGFSQRLSTELSELYLSSSYRAKTCVPLVTSPSSSDYGQFSWIGGAILASLSTFQQIWVTKDEYDESGPSIAHRKCF